MIAMREKGASSDKVPFPSSLIVLRGTLPAFLVFLASLWLLSLGQFTVRRITTGLEHPYVQLDNEEGALLAQTLELRGGTLPYRPLVDYPYIVGTYPPLYLAAAAFCTTAETPSFYGGRLVSAIAAAMCLVALAVTGWRLGRSFLSAVVAPSLFLGTFEVYSWSPYFRTDFLALAFSLLGLCVGLSFFQKRVALVFSALLFACAFFTKQTSIAAPLALSVALLGRNRRAVALFVFTYLSAVAIPFALLTLLTRGQFFVHTVLYNANRMNWPDLIVWAKHVWRFYPWLLGLVVAALVLPHLEELSGKSSSIDPSKNDTSDASTHPAGDAELLSVTPPSCARSKDSQGVLSSAAAIYFLFSLINFVAIAKAGSAENYLLEPLAAAALLVGTALGRFARPSPSANDHSLHVQRVLTVLFLCHAVHVAHWAPVMFSPAKQPTSEDFKLAAVLTQRLRSVADPVISELAGYTIFAGKKVLFQPFIMSELARQGRWDESHFVRDIANHRFSLIATTVDLTTNAYSDAFTPAMREAIRTHYERAEKFESGQLWRYYLFCPKRDPVQPITGKKQSG